MHSSRPPLLACLLVSISPHALRQTLDRLLAVQTGPREPLAAPWRDLLMELEAPADRAADQQESDGLAYQSLRAVDTDLHAALFEDNAPTLTAVVLPYQEISRVVLNLVANALYALGERRPNGARPRPAELRVSTRRSPETMEIHVHDNGVGIPDDVKPRLFDPFFTPKPAGEGTGLGLSMCYDIGVKRRGGRLEVESIPDQFTELTIIAPLVATGEPS